MIKNLANKALKKFAERYDYAVGDAGLITLGLAISTSRVCPTFKYSLGFARSCSRVVVDGKSIAPGATLGVGVTL